MLMILLADAASSRMSVCEFYGRFPSSFRRHQYSAAGTGIGHQIPARITHKSYGAHLVRINNWARKQLN